jgi:hypothetical protein
MMCSLAYYAIVQLTQYPTEYAVKSPDELNTSCERCYVNLVLLKAHDQASTELLTRCLDD